MLAKCHSISIARLLLLYDTLYRVLREIPFLSLANRFGPDPPFRVVRDCKANVKLCILLPDTREIIIGVTIGLNWVIMRSIGHMVGELGACLDVPVWPKNVQQMA